MKKNADRFLTATYCDDIRQEVGNKISLMGCYQGELVVPSAPLALPKLCVFISASTPNGRPFKTLAIRIAQEDAELARLDIPEDALNQAAQNPEATSTRLSVSTAIAFAPFVIDGLTALRIFATTEEGELVGPRLLIKILSAQAIPEQVVPSKKPTKARTAKKKPVTRRTSSAG